MTAAERLVHLLKTFNEARVSYGLGSTGEGVTLMPSMWAEGSYEELERRLIDLRESQRPLWWHVSQRYRWGSEHTMILPVNRRRKDNPQFILPRCTELVAGGAAIGSRHAIARIYRWIEDVDEQKVTAGVTLLTSLMYDGRSDLIVLPRDIYDRAVGRPLTERVA